MPTTLKLTSTIRALLDWEEVDTDENISLQSDEGINSASIFYTYGSGDSQINEAWFKELTIPASSSYTVNLLSLPVTILNMTIAKDIDNLKGLFIENTAESGYLTIGNSGISFGVDFMGSQMEVGYSGIYEMNSKTGISITSSKCMFIIRNPSSVDVTCKVLALGVT